MNVLFELKNSHFPMYVLHDIYMVDHEAAAAFGTREADVYLGK